MVLVILLNPVRVQEEPGISPPEVFYLIDSSNSMALGMLAAGGRRQPI